MYGLPGCCICGSVDGVFVYSVLDPVKLSDYQGLPGEPLPGASYQACSRHSPDAMEETTRRAPLEELPLYVNVPYEHVQKIIIERLAKGE